MYNLSFKFWYPTVPNLGRHNIDHFSMFTWRPILFEFATNYIMHFVIVFLASLITYKYFSHKSSLKNHLCVKLLVIVSGTACLFLGLIILAVILNKVTSLSL